jgi:L-alanine-DL-glutamate epimerase-like enolase superfamily enzyme
MILSRRNFMKAALAMPVCASSLDFEALAAPARKQIRITAIKALETRVGTIIRIETDAGFIGYGPSASSGPSLATGPYVRDVIREFSSDSGSTAGLTLIGKDPLDIEVHHFNMFYAYPQRTRHWTVLSGIDIALWDLAGNILGQPVSKLLGGNFRGDILLYSHCPHTGDFWSKEDWRKRAQELKDDKFGFQAYKVDLNDAMGTIARRFVPSLGPREVRKVALCYELAREAIGPDIDIIVHGHNELDTAGAIQVGESVKNIKPLWYEDPLAPYHSESWVALRRSTTVPLMTGENLELLDDASPFILNQTVDCLQPDLVQGGGITGVKRIADLAALYRMPVCLHNPGNVLLNMASVQWTAAVHNAPMMECGRGAGQSEVFASNAPVVKNGRMIVSTLPGLGLDLNQDYLKANMAKGEPWWG